MGSHWNLLGGRERNGASCFSSAPRYQHFLSFFFPFLFLLRTRGGGISSEERKGKRKNAWTINLLGKNKYLWLPLLCAVYISKSFFDVEWKRERKGTKSFFPTLFLCGSWLNQLYLYFIKFYLHEKSVLVPPLVAGRPRIQSGINK